MLRGPFKKRFMRLWVQAKLIWGSSDKVPAISVQSPDAPVCESWGARDHLDTVSSPQRGGGRNRAYPSSFWDSRCAQAGARAGREGGDRSWHVGLDTGDPLEDSSKSPGDSLGFIEMSTDPDGAPDRLSGRPRPPSQ